MGILLAVIVKEFQQIFRDRRMMRMVLMAPILELVVFGYAANTEVRHIPLLVVDQDRTQASRGLVDRFLATEYFDLAGTAETAAEVERWFIGGKAALAVVIGEGYGAAVALHDAGAERSGPPGASGASTPTARSAIQLLSDGSNSTVATIGLQYASGILAHGSGSGPITLESRAWYNPSLKSRWFYVPAVLAMVLMLMTLILSSMSIVKERELGTMEQLIVTPIRSWQLIVGKLTPFLVIGVVDILLVTAVAVGFFQVPMRGSFPLLLLFSLLFIAVMLGLGLFMSTLARNQQQAMIGSIFLIMVPMMYLSGLVFPIENMPEPIQAVTVVIPLKYYTSILRGIFLKGSGVDILWPDALALVVSGVLILTLASLRFRKRLD